MAHQPREPVLPERALYLTAETACAERKPRDFHSRSAQRDDVSRASAPGEEGNASGDGQRSGGEAGFQEFASSEMRHCVLL
jgi:hypothetical protein